MGVLGNIDMLASVVRNLHWICHHICIQLSLFANGGMEQHSSEYKEASLFTYYPFFEGKKIIRRVRGNSPVIPTVASLSKQTLLEGLFMPRSRSKYGHVRWWVSTCSVVVKYEMHVDLLRAILEMPPSYPYVIWI